jgi:hypothetical protein
MSLLGIDAIGENHVNRFFLRIRAANAKEFPSSVSYTAFGKRPFLAYLAT